MPGPIAPTTRGTTVDFWDLTKLLARRWVIVLPMLAVSALLAVLTVGQVKPDYVATAYVQLVPPVLEQTKPNQATPDQRNPWLGLGLQTIGNAAVVTVQDKSVVDMLKASGLSETFTLTMAQQSPLVTFEIVGSTALQARHRTTRGEHSPFCHFWVASVNSELPGASCGRSRCRPPGG